MPNASKQRKFIVPMEVEQTMLDDLLADGYPLGEDDPDALLGATLLSEEADEPCVEEDALAGGYRPKLQFEPRSDQVEAIESWLKHDGRGVVVLPTGAGKTVVALMALARLKLRTLIVVPTIELLYQWRDAVVERLSLPRRVVGVVGDGHKEWRPITVITYA